jgi:hypothetical protein
MLDDGVCFRMPLIGFDDADDGADNGEDFRGLSLL